MRVNVPWDQVRSAYATIILKVENQEIDWDTDWYKYERLIYDKVVPTTISNFKGDKSGKQENRMKSYGSGKNFQKPEGCSKESPHAGKVGNSFKQMYHICALCWLKERVKRSHPECSSDCPNKEL